MSQVRCPECNSRWFDARGVFELEIVCKRCKSRFHKVVFAEGRVEMYAMPKEEKGKA